MRKLTILFIALTLSAGLWANQITYKATAALPIEGDAFTPSVSSHTFLDGVGYINFSSGDVTEINNNAFKTCTEMTSITLPNTITRIGEFTFAGCDGLTSFTIPASVTTIGDCAFAACKFLTSITFEGTACQYAIGESAFQYVGDGNETTTNLTLPEDWNYANAPANSSTAWYGGYFNSNLYSEDEATDKQAAIDALTAILSDYSTSAYLQSLLAEEVAKINSAVNRTQVNERKQAAMDKLTFVVNNYAAGKAELLGDMGEECTDCTAVEVKKGDKVVTLYAPDKVGYIKVTEGE
ncbi:MAG: leucine-rich repeat domain-containing protein [Paludibacteraceae bacterium]|nr:leucine-rich repeat domain-containing protein [Paludibacteraceae bacterium]